MPGPRGLTEREFIVFYIESLGGYFLEAGQTFIPNPNEVVAFENVKAKLKQVTPEKATLQDLFQIADLVNMTTSPQFLGARLRADQVFNESKTYRRGRLYKKSRKRTKKKKKVGGNCSKTKRLTTKRRRKSRRKSKRR